MPVWLHQGALQRLGQEHRAVDDAVCAEQFVDGPPATHGGAGMSAPEGRVNARRQRETALYPSQNALKSDESVILISLDEFLTANSRESVGYSDHP